MRAKVPEWVITAMNSIGDKTIGFEDDSGTEGAIEPTETLEVGQLEGLAEDDEIDQEANFEGPDGPDIDELDDAIRVLERADALEEEPEFEVAVTTRAHTDQERFRAEQEADKYAEYVAMGWREPEAQDVGKVVFNTAFKRTEGEILRNSYLSRHGAEMNNAGAANIYFDQAMKTKPNEA